MIIWTQSELIDIMKDTRPPQNTGSAYRLDMAKNEGESFQIGIYADKSDLVDVSIEIESVPDFLKCEINIMDFIFYSSSSVRAGNKILRAKGPAEIPEIVSNKTQTDVPFGSSRSALITVFSEKFAPVGIYRINLLVKSAEGCEKISVETEIYDVDLPDPENSDYGYICWANTTINRDCKALYNIEPFSDEYWEMNKKYAKQLYKERQNWFSIDLSDFIIFGMDESGQYTFDYTYFDRYLEIYIKYMKPQYIAAMHLLSRDWAIKFPDYCGLTCWMFEKNSDGKIIKTYRPASEIACQDFIRKLFFDLSAHLNDKGWYHMWAQHVADEINTNIQYEQCLYYYKLVHECMPGVRTIDAVRNESITYFGKELDIHVPMSWLYDRSPEHYDEINKGSTQVWFYTCLQPQYNYMGRIGDYNLMGNRLLHWYSFKYNLKGYLHYAWNAWSLCRKPYYPEEDASCFDGFPCDGWLAYPDRENKGSLWSIRGIGNRDSLEDIELLYIAEKKDKKATRMIVELLIGSAEDYTLNPGVLKAARAKLLKIASR